ncbi:hypothetical protein [Caballeronia sp. LZ016]|uniref:hypothetical protein n=1 Tax=Caballeronia sp. LZ016 TaxID=3038554 RepID=UPI00286487AC|nr:hypothetical protein [Caballeronia sp. LZ016]MDR5737631.1 hypothetical protein [Caballeronia sp. LZ016]
MVSPFVSLVDFALCYFARLHIKPDRIARQGATASGDRGRANRRRERADDCTAKRPRCCDAVLREAGEETKTRPIDSGLMALGSSMDVLPHGARSMRGLRQSVRRMPGMPNYRVSDR